MCFLKGHLLNTATENTEKASEANQFADRSSPEDLGKNSPISTCSHKQCDTHCSQSKEQELPMVGMAKQDQLLFISNMLAQNSFTTFALVQRFHAMESIITSLQKQIAILKNQGQVADTEKIISTVSLNPESEPKDAFLMKIFKQKEYRYRLELSEPTETLLYKERNFNLKIKLVDSAGNEISNSNPIPISLGVYTTDEEPQIILKNKHDQPLLKGNSEGELFHGVASFSKMHYREVTSYYANGWVNMVVFPKQPSFAYNAKESSIQKVISFDHIKPLVISEVTVRAKRK